MLLSHQQHEDNLDHSGRELLDSVPAVYTTLESAEELASAHVAGLEPWEELQIHGANGTELTLTATPARHGPPGCEPMTGEVTGFVLRCASAAGAVYLSGDTVWYEGVEHVAERFDVRVAVPFMGAAKVAAAGDAHLTMTAEEGVMLAGAMPAARIFPVHFEGWAHFSEDRAAIADAFARHDLSDRLVLPKPGERTDLSF